MADEKKQKKDGMKNMFDMMKTMKKCMSEERSGCDSTAMMKSMFGKEHDGQDETPSEA